MPTSTFHNLPDAKRERIVAAAVEVFAAAPYARAHLDDVARKADVSKGSLYQYFAGKADLYGWLVTGHLAARKVAAITAEAPGPDASVWDVFEQAVYSGVRFAVREPLLTRLGLRFHQDQSLEPALRTLAVETKAAGRAWVVGQLERGVSRGEIRPDVDLNVASGFLAYALGEGMLDPLAHTLGRSTEALLADPDALADLDEADLHGPVRAILSLLRGGLDPHGGLP